MDFDPRKMTPWRLDELPPPGEEAPRVVSTFSSGGGSTMGYKLAGMKVIGAVDIDPQMMSFYKQNLDTENTLIMGVGDVKTQRPDVIEYWRDVGVDILDGSPPCTLFSTARKEGRDHYPRGGSGSLSDGMRWNAVRTQAPGNPPLSGKLEESSLNRHSPRSWATGLHRV